MRLTIATLFMAGLSFGQSQADNRTLAANKSIVSVRDAPYNAKCDGATDDTAAFNSAYATISAAGGGAFQVSPGVICRVAGVIVQSNVQLFGNGSTLKLVDHICDAGPCTRGNILQNISTWNEVTNAGRSINPANTAYMVSNVTVQDVVFDGNMANNTAARAGDAQLSWAGAGINIANGNKIVIQRCVFENNRLDGVVFGHDPEGGTDNSTIEDSRFIGNARTAIAQIVGKYNTFKGNVILHTGTGCAFDFESNADNEINLGHRIVQNPYIGSCISIASTHAMIATGILIQGNPEIHGAVSVWPQSAGGLQILDNTLMGPGQDARPAAAGVALNGNTAVNIIDPIVIGRNHIANFDTGIGYPGGPSAASAVGSTGKFTAFKNQIGSVKYGFGIFRSGDVWAFGNELELVGAACYVIFRGQGQTYANQGRIRIDDTKYDSSSGGASLLSEALGANVSDELPGPYTILTGNDFSACPKVPGLALSWPTALSYNRIADPCQATVNVSGTAVTWVSGPRFASAYTGATVDINGSQYTFTYVSATSGTISAPASLTGGTMSFVAVSGSKYLSGQLDAWSGWDITGADTPAPRR